MTVAYLYGFNWRMAVCFSTLDNMAQTQMG